MHLNNFYFSAMNYSSLVAAKKERGFLNSAVPVTRNTTISF